MSSGIVPRGRGVPNLSRGDGGTGTGIPRRHSKHDRGDGRWAGWQVAGLALGGGCFLPCTVICLEWGDKWLLVCWVLGLQAWDFLNFCVSVCIWKVCPLCSGGRLGALEAGSMCSAGQ